MPGELRLYLMRHGEAGSAPRDEVRELTQRGREHCRHNLLKALPRLASAPATVVSSPYSRALQTAAIAHAILGDGTNPPPLLVDDCLVPDASPRAIADFIEGLGEDAWPLVLVGHQPLLGALLAWLTDRDDLAASVATASISALDMVAFARGGASLDWQIH